MKKTVIFFPFNLMAHYLRCLVIADALREEFDIYFVDSKEYADLILSHGFKTIDYQHPEVDEIIEKAGAFNFDWINSHSIRTMFDAQLDIVQRYKPDLVFSDTSLTLPMCAEYANVPVISIMNAYVSNYYADIRPLPYSHRAYKYQFKLKQPIWEKILKTAEKASMKFVHKPFARLRNELNLSKKQWLLDEFEGDFNLLCDLPELFPTENLPENFASIGPVIYHSNQEESDLVDWINSPDDRPLIYLSLGSSGVEVSLDFLNQTRAKDFRFVLSGAKEIENSENLRYQKFVNFEQIQKHVDLFISHGGNGSIYQALAAAVPLLLIPAFFEQAWNAHPIKKLDIGVVIQPNELDDIFTTMHKLINEGKTDKRLKMQELIHKNPFEIQLLNAVNRFLTY
jgi:UDP:flavonoid glycosyltransferase YjiC (YdhE family)